MENGRIERTFTLAPGVTPAIVARIPSGTMQIHGEERSDVAVTVTVHPADAIGRDLEVILEEQGETIHAEVRGPRRGDRSSAGCAASPCASRWRFTPPCAATSRRKRRARTSTWSGWKGDPGTDGERRHPRRPPRPDVMIQTASGDIPPTPSMARPRSSPPAAMSGSNGARANRNVQTRERRCRARSHQRDAGSDDGERRLSGALLRPQSHAGRGRRAATSR